MRKTPVSVRSAILAAVLLVLAYAGGCAGPTTSYEQVWRGPPAQVSSIQNIAALYESQDGAMRRTVEDAMVYKLSQRGVRAVPAYTVLQGEAINNHDKAKQTLLDAGFDGVVVIRFIGTETYPGDMVYSTWGPGWPMAYEDYVFAYPVVRVETSLYSLHTDQLVWSARSKTVDADDTNEVIDEVTSLAAATLQRQGVAGGSASATARR
jgi:hypothetical protein